MPLSNSVIRRYTPPTCTLEVFAQDSALSRWMGKTVLKQLSFELRFDDPRLPEESRFPIRGDRDQLEALCDAVTSYVQQFLHQSPESFWLSFTGPQDSSKVADNCELSDFAASSVPATTKSIKSFPTYLPQTKIYLEPSSYLTHNLFLGSLANQTSGPVIQLSLLQLFDLATALDEYSADIMALPSLENTRSSTVRFPTWAPAAAVLVLGVGLLPITWQYVNNAKPKQQVATKTTTDSSEIALQPSPSSLNPEASLLPPDNLPPVPPIGSTQPLPVVPTALPTAPSSTLTNPSATLPNSSFPTAQTTANSKLPKSNQPSAASSVFGIPEPTSPTLTANSPFKASTSGQQIAIQPNPTANRPGTTNPAELALPKRRELPPSLTANRGSVNPNVVTTAPPLPTVPNEIASSAKVDGDYNPASTTSTVTTGSTLAERLRNQRQTVSSNQPTSDSTLFDTVQISEARQYLQKRWQPPSGLRQTLEYSLMVNVDGTIERIFPLNKAAREFVENTGMPNIGAPFVSANKAGQNMRMRAVLTPDGKVQIFPEN
ncbi:DUF4335 domain-containing protein [Calothrix sp. FACHB-1219]|uniref:DUF4335 domain-containing protein n=1 Tax=unclassified Calothrix TaxID=2619626 RepID=UPI00168938B9|nr:MULTISPECIES: DUF4335 domain-containing protein [unclassified Calothrix]MBD2203939.1 DUF4335 domain-containing protein [Calothrix sp. FACHB-168]MBD2218276.1 DUF4335 domain-containing protein [Calothrix sp. FACHB-1219]